MPMISIKRYLDSSSHESCQRILTLLVEIATHTPIEFDLAECERFQREINGIQEHFPADGGSQELFAAAALVGQAVERHDRLITGMVRSQGSELQNMITMLTSTLRSISSASENSGKNLDVIASQLKHASALEDIKELRRRMEECLTDLRQEATRQKRQDESNIQVLHQGLSSARQRLAARGLDADIDLVTGLAGRRSAEKALLELAERQETRYVLAVVLSRLRAINLRFGEAVGDEVLCEFAARVAGALCTDAQFYRWSGPTVLGILKRYQPLRVVEAEVAEVLEPPIMKSLSGGKQNAFIALSPTWIVIPAATPADEVIARIDRFVWGQVPAERKPEPAKPAIPVS